ncbi:bifunctional DNA-formamidopyrimidine glycosylase/DNA-(apurinic or apyrimidinic site) lyase [Hydrogenophaga sp.]|jgi:formamidopyrimidine-DNA glycosylase|uniref:bifunctional DNA-formamidopyrimidine glycosylase/DNA-(apurinic or apyrimidinic site) lyase n=1 Tax=Hydrogenophaga sp. TaxID=1904254 RepID=UPI00273134FF|nr:bifunctional DNA-formamidopyrimidine glycosylase/DNA-(apurinic or apyrimidinic site) lyase [Hydrogenophaga sp.]MDP1687256.1 bifunctional DNA-formamidopyrimidine glycosylase/DNA-(apurinic or apyrimidinic site) lyase [Hydrogenophaga sp.]
MPELPEVEVTRRSFADRIAGASILRLEMGKPLRWPLGCDVATLEGRMVRSVTRRGKYLLLNLDRGLLLVHLGMSGSLQFAHALPLRGVHDHFELSTSQGVLRLHDPRRFGAVVYADALDSVHAAKLLGGLGVEPLEEGFHPLAFHRALQLRRSAIKQVLLAGDIVVGVGNIYASEALFMAGIRPTLRANGLSKPRAAKLHGAIVQVLTRAVALGGSTLRDFSSAEGQSGYFQLDAMVYGREGQPCRVCGTPIKSFRQGQRSTFFCTSCQKN